MNYKSFVDEGEKYENWDLRFKWHSYVVQKFNMVAGVWWHALAMLVFMKNHYNISGSSLCARLKVVQGMYFCSMLDICHRNATHRVFFITMEN